MYVCLYVCMDGCMHACMHACMDGWMDVCMYVCMYVRTYVHIDVCTYNNVSLSIETRLTFFTQNIRNHLENIEVRHRNRKPQAVHTYTHIYIYI